LEIISYFSQIHTYWTSIGCIAHFLVAKEREEVKSKGKVEEKKKKDEDIDLHM